MLINQTVKIQNFTMSFVTSSDRLRNTVNYRDPSSCMRSLGIFLCILCKLYFFVWLYLLKENATDCKRGGTKESECRENCVFA